MAREGESIRRGPEPVEVRALGRVDYAPTWDLQRELALARAAGEIGDTLLLLEHPTTYTAGRQTRPEDLPGDGSPVIDVDRGGRITWHGPGQLVAYPLVALADPIDVVDYVRRIEAGIIATCTRLGVEVGRVEGRSGVWCAADPGGSGRPPRPERKIAAIGIRVQRGVTMHGLALNCDCDLDAFSRIVPCGIADAGVTSLSAELGRRVTVEEVSDGLAADVSAALDGRIPLDADA